MNSAINLQFAIGIFTSILVTGAWWYIAVRLPYHWILYALAVMSTIGLVLSMAFTVSLQAHQPLSLLSLIGQLRTGAGLLNALLYVAFAGWITSRAKSST